MANLETMGEAGEHVVPSCCPYFFRAQKIQGQVFVFFRPRVFLRGIDHVQNGSSQPGVKFGGHLIERIYRLPSSAHSS